MISKIAFRCLWVVLLGVLAVPAFAQFNSNVQGTVTDPAGGVVPDAKVTLHNVDTGVDGTTTTNGSGGYRFNAVAPGRYQVIVEAKNFARHVTDVAVTTNQLAGVDAKLELATATIKMEVTSEAPTVNPDETRIQATLEASEIVQLPLQNGNVYETLRVGPGVTGIDEGGSANGLAVIAVGGPLNLNAQANGRPATSNLYMMDGVSVNSNTYGGGQVNVMITPNPDSVQEITLETQTYSVDNGAGSSMRVNLTTKSGTNDWHGDGSFRYSSKGLNAVPLFSGGVQPFTKKWYNGSVGGPVIKDKTFFFVSYLNQKAANPQPAPPYTYASPEFVKWAIDSFPNSLDVKNEMVKFPNTDIKFQQVALTADGTTGNGGTPPSPITKDPTTGLCSFAFNAVPNGPVTRNIPITCNMPIQDQGVFPQNPTVNGYQFNTRGDQYFRGDKERIYVNYLQVHQTSDYLQAQPGYNAQTPSTNKYLNVNYAHTFSPTILNQASFTYTHYTSYWTDGQYETVPWADAISAGAPFADGGFASNDYFGTPGPGTTDEHNYAVRDDITWVRSKHSLKFGLQVAKQDQISDNSGGPFQSRADGFLCCSGFGGFNNWNDFFADNPANFGVGSLSAITGTWIPAINDAEALNFSVYAQDEWKVKPNLLLSFGLRWESYGNPHAAVTGLPYGQVFPGSGSTFQEQIANTYVKQVKNPLSGRQNMNFLPRGGFAWSPDKSRKWSIRGGAGFYEDAFDFYSLASPLQGNPPGLLSETFAFDQPGYNNTSSGMCPGPTKGSAPVSCATYLYGTTPGKPPYGYVYPYVQPLGFDSRGAVITAIDPVTGAITTAPANLSGNNNNLRPQKTALYSLSVERELWKHIVVGASYTGSYSWDQYYGGDLNTFPGDMIGDGTQNRLTPEWGSIGYKQNGVSANYNALILQVRHSGGPLTVQGSFTHGRNLGDSGSPNPYQPRQYYGPSSIDVADRFSFEAVYDVPSLVKKGFAKYLTDGWIISGIAIAQTGTPFSVTSTAGYFQSGSGASANYNCFLAAVPASATNNGQPGGTANPPCDITNAGDFLAVGGSGSTSYPTIAPGMQTGGFSTRQYETGIFTASQFTLPSGYGLKPVEGNQGVNIFREPGYFTTDMALRKKTTLPFEHPIALILGVEGSNIFNRVNLGSVNINPSAANFGLVNSARQARVLQLVAQFTF